MISGYDSDACGWAVFTYSLTKAQMYVAGQLADADNVLVDIGTGYYVEKVSQPYHIMHIAMSAGLHFNFWFSRLHDCEAILYTVLS